MSRKSEAVELSKEIRTNRTRRSGMAVIAMCLLGINPATAAEYYLSGNMVNITSDAAGLRITLNSGVPDNCQGVGYGWMLIPESNKTMVAVALAMWTTGNLHVTVYTNPLSNGNCVINQFDPA